MDKKNALIHAIEKGNLDIIKLLLNNSNIDINQKLINFYNLKFIYMKYKRFDLCNRKRKY